MKKKLTTIQIGIEVFPIYTLCGRGNIVQLSDFAYGEWLIFRSNKPIFYINIFDDDFFELRILVESKKTTIEEVIEKFNIQNNDSLSLKQSFFGITNYKNIEFHKIEVHKFPFSIEIT
jgi:hypothetical protein